MITLRERVIAFFVGAPTEELTSNDIMVRWGVGYMSAYRCVACLRADGLIDAYYLGVRRYRGTGQRFTYRPTKKLLSLGRGV